MNETIGQFIECTLYGVIPKERYSELIGRIKAVCEVKTERKIIFRETTFKPKNPKHWSPTESAHWITSRIGKDISQILFQFFQQSLNVVVDGNKLLNLSKEELSRSGISPTAVDAIVTGISSLKTTEREIEREGSETEVKIRKDEVITPENEHKQHQQKQQCILRMASQLSSFEREKLKVDARSITQVDVVDGDAFIALETSGLLRTHEILRHGISFNHHSGVCVSVFEVRKPLFGQTWRELVERPAIIGDQLAMGNWIVELRLNTSIQNIKQASEHLSAFAASLSPFEFYIANPN